ncbi:MAG: 3-dehydroquinate synthase [Proteobacteria bacterium]|nr:3-dehydroquinate synthase [Pseudomonadota bacterium]
METLALVQTAGGHYPVLCGDDPSALLARVWDAGWRQAALIGDSNTLPRFGPALASALAERCDTVLQLAFPAGEAHKTRETKQRLEDTLLAAGFERGCCLVGLGGGIALDVAGFVAATLLRGVAHINLATSLLAQVDAAVGGKTGVNTAQGKNLIGAFHQPRAVLIDYAALASLPLAELRNGLAEAVKHAVVADAALFAALEAWAEGGAAGALLPRPLLARCVQIKAEVVARDEREQAYRQVLNFGHTVAHAIEAASDHEVAHGAAVAIGMVVEARAAERLCGFPAAESERLRRLLQRLRLPIQSALPFAALRDRLGHDKKTRGGMVHCALPERLGHMHEAEGRWALPTPVELLAEVWQPLD